MENYGFALLITRVLVYDFMSLNPPFSQWRTFGFVEPMSVHFDIVINLNVKAKSSNVLSCTFYSELI